MTTELARQQTTQLSLTEVKHYLSPNATDAEAYQFIRFCQAYDLNPWIREVYLVKYDRGAAASIVVGKDAVMKRAQGAADYKGHHAGIVVKEGTVVRELEGSILSDGAVLIGGWCKLHPRERDADPTIHRVSLVEYDRKQALWKTMPATMIRKVAVVQAHREAYPELTGGMYDSAEMPVVIDGTGVVVPTEAPSASTHEAPSASTQRDSALQGNCPLHPQDTWRESRYGESAPEYHYVGKGKNAPTCSPIKAYREQLHAAAEQAGIDAEGVSSIMRSKFDKVPSKLNLNEVQAILADLRRQAEPVTAPTEDEEPPEEPQEDLAETNEKFF